MSYPFYVAQGLSPAALLIYWTPPRVVVDNAVALRRCTWRDALGVDVLGLASQLSYYFFLALFPTILFLLALASFFPPSNLTDGIWHDRSALVSPSVLDLIQDQMRRLANNESRSLLTFGVAGAL